MYLYEPIGMYLYETIGMYLYVLIGKSVYVYLLIHPSPLRDFTWTQADLFSSRVMDHGFRTPTVIEGLRCNRSPIDVLQRCRHTHLPIYPSTQTHSPSRHHSHKRQGGRRSKKRSTRKVTLRFIYMNLYMKQRRLCSTKKPDIVAANTRAVVNIVIANL